MATFIALDLSLLIHIKNRGFSRLGRDPAKGGGQAVALGPLCDSFPTLLRLILSFLKLSEKLKQNRPFGRLVKKPLTGSPAWAFIIIEVGSPEQVVSPPQERTDRVFIKRF